MKKVLIIGAGRMGIRHAQGIVAVPEIGEIVLTDIYPSALEKAKEVLSDGRFGFYLLGDEKLKQDYSSFDICIISATANDRLSLLELAKQFRTKHILVEKPLGQSMQQVEALVRYVKDNALDCVVNLNMRLYDSFVLLKKDLQSLPQFQGHKTISLNTGSLGIGANGIHYLDLLYFLLDADDAELEFAEIDEQLIPSGRGPQFSDFGGCAVLKFYKKGNDVGRALIAMSAESTVFGGWEIIGRHGRIQIDELAGKRVDILRKEESNLPVNRYAADYLPAVERTFESPFLGDLTRKWIESVFYKKVNLLPAIDESVKVHQLLFQWLSLNKTHREKFPIT